MPYCKECGRELERDAKFCPHCGTRAPVKALKVPKEPKVLPEAPMKMEHKIAIIAAVVTAVVIIVVLAAHFSGGGGSGGDRGTPPSAMITLWAETPAANTVRLTIRHEGGTMELPVTDLQIMATNSAEGGMVTINGTEMGVGSTFSVGETGSVTYAYPGVKSGDRITVYIIHVPSKQKIFSSSSVVVR